MNILQIIYLLIPAALANMAPVFASRINFLDYPADFGFKIYGKRIFGEHKTFRGFFFGILASIAVVFLQYILYNFEFFRYLSLIDFDSVNFLAFGFLTGFGVLFGDLIGSFVKRRFDFKPGKSLFFLDQTNSIIGFGVFVVWVYFKSWSLFFYALALWFFGHLIFKYFGYLFGMYKEKI